jgi:hypothetical protein
LDRGFIHEEEYERRIKENLGNGKLISIKMFKSLFFQCKEKKIASNRSQAASAYHFHDLIVNVINMEVGTSQFYIRI